MYKQFKLPIAIGLVIQIELGYFLLRYLMTIRIVLKRTRQEQGLSREELAYKSGVSISYLIRLEQDRVTRPSLEILDALCKVLGCGINGILEFEDDDEF